MQKYSVIFMELGTFMELLLNANPVFKTLNWI